MLQTDLRSRLLCDVIVAIKHIHMVSIINSLCMVVLLSVFQESSQQAHVELSS